MSKLTQEQQVLKHLKKHNHITSWEAISLYHITRLADRIFSLRAQGYAIATNMQSQQDGKKWAKYIYFGDEK
jgi:hypothetical protein